MRALALGCSLFLSISSLGAMTHAGVDVQVEPDVPVHYDDDYYSDGHWVGPYWHGPGLYWGIYFSNEAAFRGWQRNHRWHGHYHHHGHHSHHGHRGGHHH